MYNIHTLYIVYIWGSPAHADGGMCSYVKLTWGTLVYAKGVITLEIALFFYLMPQPK
jgi:hypothetical protein